MNDESQAPLQGDLLFSAMLKSLEECAGRLEMIASDIRGKVGGENADSAGYARLAARTNVVIAQAKTIKNGQNG